MMTTCFPTEYLGEDDWNTRDMTCIWLTTKASAKTLGHVPSHGRSIDPNDPFDRFWNFG